MFMAGGQERQFDADCRCRACVRAAFLPIPNMGYNFTFTICDSTALGGRKRVGRDGAGQLGS